MLPSTDIVHITCTVRQCKIFRAFWNKFKFPRVSILFSFLLSSFPPPQFPLEHLFKVVNVEIILDFLIAA